MSRIIERHLLRRLVLSRHAVSSFFRLTMLLNRIANLFHVNIKLSHSYHCVCSMIDCHVSSWRCPALARVQLETLPRRPSQRLQKFSRTHQPFGQGAVAAFAVHVTRESHINELGAKHLRQCLAVGEGAIFVVACDHEAGKGIGSPGNVRKAGSRIPNVASNLVE
jgi:hypothetical protein